MTNEREVEARGTHLSKTTKGEAAPVAVHNGRSGPPLKVRLTTELGEALESAAPTAAETTAGEATSASAEPAPAAKA